MNNVKGYEKVNEILEVLEKFCNDNYEKNIIELGFQNTQIGDYLTNVENKLCIARDALREVQLLLVQAKWVEEK